MNRTVGLLPAAGSASRLGGIPKFLMPVSETESAFAWHLNQMKNYCDELRVVTRGDFRELILPQKKKYGFELIISEPTSMVNALSKMQTEGGGERYLIGMPDTVFIGSDNVYEFLSSHQESSIVLAAFEFNEEMRGKVGQISVDSDGVLIDLVDKDSNCTHPYMWGAFTIDRKIPDSFVHPGAYFVNQMKNEKIKCILSTNTYHDLGTFQGVVDFYKSVTK